jgi:hypothetical protein
MVRGRKAGHEIGNATKERLRLRFECREPDGGFVRGTPGLLSLCLRLLRRLARPPGEVLELLGAARKPPGSLLRVLHLPALQDLRAAVHEQSPLLFRAGLELPLA